jgi:hypothetical protein
MADAPGSAFAMLRRLAAATLGIGFPAIPADAQEYTTYEYLEVESPLHAGCRDGMLLHLPPSWQSGDGAAILLTEGLPGDTTRHALVSALLQEHAAVLELAPLSCDAPRDRDSAIVSAAFGALAAIERNAGAGLVVAIGQGPDGAAILGVVRQPTGSQLGTGGPGFAAAIALGGGAPRIAFGPPPPAREGAPIRLAALCHALAALPGVNGETAEPAGAAVAAATCDAAMPAGTSLPASEQPARSRR